MVNGRSYNRSGQGRRHDGWSDDVDTDTWDAWDAWERYEKTSNMGRPVGRKWNTTWVTATTMRVEQEGGSLSDKDMEAWVTNMESEIESRFKKASRDMRLNISTLNFSNNHIADAGVHTVVEFLRKRQIGVDKIMFFKNDVSDEGAKAIGQLLMQSPTPVQEVHLSHNNISHEGFRFILEALQQSNRYPFTPQRAWAGQKGPQAIPLWLRMESNAIDWSNLSDLMEDNVSWCTAQQKDKWHPKNDPPMVCMHGSYKKQNHSIPVSLAGGSHAETDDVDATATLNCQQSAVADDIVETVSPSNASNGKGGKTGTKKGKGEGTGDRKHWKPKLKTLEPIHVRKAVGLVANLPDFGDSSVHDRWRLHVENADNPDFEAKRIGLLCANLNEMGYGYEVSCLNSNGGTGTIISTDVVGTAEQELCSKPHLQSSSSSNENPEADTPLPEKMLDADSGDVSDAVYATVEQMHHHTPNDVKGNLSQSETSIAEHLQTCDTSKAPCSMDALSLTVNTNEGEMDKSHAVDMRNGFDSQPALSMALDGSSILTTAELTDTSALESPARKKKGRNKMPPSKMSTALSVVYQ